MKNYIDRIKEDYEKMRVVESNVLDTYEKGYIGKKTIEYTLADGSKVIADQIRKNKRNGDAAVIVPVTEDNNFVMVVQARPNTGVGVCVEFPAGMVDPGEDNIVAAARELKEETGYECESIYELEAHYQDQGCSAAIIRTYVATGCKKVAEQSLDSDEHLDFIELSYDTVLDMVMSSDVNKVGINDAGSKLAFMNYVIKNNK